MARNEGGSASSEGFFQPSASGSVNSSADFQRLCDNALKECPISFGEGATVADFGDRLALLRPRHGCASLFPASPFGTPAPLE